YNAFEVNDGYVDVIGTILGTPAAADQVVQASASNLVNPHLTDLIGFASPDQQYSYSFDGDAQTLDHELVNANLLTRFNRIAYGRIDADYPESFRSDPNRPERLSDHDPVVAYFELPAVPTPTPTPTPIPSPTPTPTPTPTPAPTPGSISLTTLGLAACENFDTLANSATSSLTPTGWRFSESGTAANTTYTAGTGSSTTGDTYSFGATSSSERAFGALQTGTLIPTIGASFTNNTGQTIKTLVISYAGEQWRLGDTDRHDRHEF